MNLTNKQWEKVKPLIPENPRRADGRGRPWRDNREVLNGILWVLQSGSRWKDLPDKYPPYQTCHRRMQQWREAGVFREILHALGKELNRKGGLDLSEAYIDATFAPAKSGGAL